MSTADGHHVDQPTTDGRHDDAPTDAWTAKRIRSLGVVTDLTTAAHIFGLSRATAYDLAKRGLFPVTVLRFGTRYRIPVAAILHALGEPADRTPPDPPTTSTT